MSPADYKILLAENNAFKHARWMAKQNRDRVFMFLLVGGFCSYFFVLLGLPMYDQLRADHEVSQGWCGSYQSLAVWEHETEHGHVVLNISPNLVKAYTVMEGERRMEVELKLIKALNGENELCCWTSSLDDGPPLILRQMVPGVWQVLLHRPESTDAELEWVPVERHYVR